MKAEIKFLSGKKLVGKRMRMSFTDNRTSELWRNFMPGRKEIKNNLTDELFSMQVYDQLPDFKSFNPHLSFEKWAAVEVADFDTIPDGMEPYVLTGGMYAVFLYKGRASEASQTFRYIFGTWLPDSDYELDHREHFEILDERYKNEQPDSEEELWIPVRKKMTESDQSIRWLWNSDDDILLLKPL